MSLLNCDNRLLTISEASEELNVSRPTLYALIRQQKIPTIQVSKRRRLHLPSVMKHLEARNRENSRRS
jgi:excisionase family DNA binding protein